MPKCKICKNTFKPIYSTLEQCCSSFECRSTFAIQVAQKNREKALKEEEKAWKERKKEGKEKLYPKETKKELQREINKLSRLIDERFGYKCICCGREYGKQRDAAHYSSIGANATIRFNLHNIHMADSYCNNYSNTHISGYYDGLIKRYGQEYADYVKYELPKTEIIKLLPNEIQEKLKLVRSIIRNIDTYVFNDGKHGRDIFNSLIGIYGKYL
jgi:hypothetical protein